MKSHIKSKHEGVKYACNQCDYQASQRGHLTSHILYKHNRNLRKHIESVNNACV